jgi:hypothetical protein
MKLNVLLAKTDSLQSHFKAMLGDYGKFFSKNQGAFKGEKGTYEPREGTIDEPKARGNTLVQTTVTEKLDWFKENSVDYINALFSQEKTNASGAATAELTVAGQVWGTFTSLELLRLKNIVESSGLYTMLSSIPVRSDSEEWAPTTNDMYKGRDIAESPLHRGINVTTEKEQYILKDPNVGKDSPNYTPSVATKTTTLELGDYTRQRFSGEWTQRDKALALRKRTTLITAIVEALKVCNEAEAVESELTSDKIFGYLFSK